MCAESYQYNVRVSLIINIQKFYLSKIRTFVVKCPKSCLTIARECPERSVTIARECPEHSVTIARESPERSVTIARECPEHSVTIAREWPERSMRLAGRFQVAMFHRHMAGMFKEGSCVRIEATFHGKPHGTFLQASGNGVCCMGLNTICILLSCKVISVSCDI